MTQYDPTYPPPPPSTARSADSVDSLLPPSERLDERAHSLSGSDDGASGIHKVETEIEEDVTLTSQTLNADGTPKRPMNAFMIFARRRRPQVSAENQSMRTGEISKLLSKEWTSMPTSEKQFYLDQAKILKENFNSKYPDYVYRRRPNNTRKKNRRGDMAGLRQLDNQLDDMGPGAHELGESSHTDEESTGGGGGGGLDPNSPYSRMQPHDVSQAYDTHGRYGSVPSRYSISSSDGFRPTTTHDTRSLPYPQQQQDRLSQDHHLATSRLAQPTHTAYTYPPYTTTSTSPLYEPVNSTESWQQHKIDRACWPQASDRMVPIANPKMDSYGTSSSPHNNSWHHHHHQQHHQQHPSEPPNPTSNGASATGTSNNNTTTTTTTTSNSYPFQALTTPFTPNQSAVTGYSSSPSPAPASHYEPSSHGSRDYDNNNSRQYAPSPSISPASYPGGGGARGVPYPQPPHRQASSISRNAAAGAITSVPGISSFNHPGMQPPPETSASHAYWSRE